MPIPKPRSGEKKSEYISRCMGNSVMVSEYEQDQRAGICYSEWDSYKKKQRANMITITAKFNFKARGRRQTISGVNYAIYPVVLLVEGVHHGAIGVPTYFPSDVLQQSIHNWNNVPVSVYHPQDENGEYVLFKDRPDLLETKIIGDIRYPWFGNGKVHAQAYINVERAERLYPGILEYLDTNRVEVSSGLEGIMDGIEGVWNEEPFETSITNISISDHLALLPGVNGACSWADGCGVRANQKSAFINLMTQSVKDSLTAQFNELSQDARGTLIRQYIDSLDVMGSNGDFTKMHIIRDIFDDYFIYMERVRGKIPTMYKQKYSFSSDDELNLIDSPIPVREETKYIPITTTDTIRRNTKMTNKADDGAAKKCCPKKIDALINSEHTSYTEEDRAWLESHEEVQIDKLVTMKDMLEEAHKKDPKDGTADASTQQFNQDGATDEEGEEENVTSYLSKIKNPQIRSMLNASLRAYDKMRGKFIEQIMAGKQNIFKVEQLKEFTDEQLEGIAALAKEPEKEEIHVDPVYFGLNGGRISKSGGKLEEPYVAQTLSAKFQKK